MGIAHGRNHFALIELWACVKTDGRRECRAHSIEIKASMETHHPPVMAEYKLNGEPKDQGALSD